MNHVIASYNVFFFKKKYKANQLPINIPFMSAGCFPKLWWALSFNTPLPINKEGSWEHGFWTLRVIFCSHYCGIFISIFNESDFTMGSCMGGFNRIKVRVGGWYHERVSDNELLCWYAARHLLYLPWLFGQSIWIVRA